MDSGTVAMKVGIRQGVCNNSPTEVRGPDNGWRQARVHCPTYTVAVLVALFSQSAMCLGDCRHTCCGGLHRAMRAL